MTPGTGKIGRTVGHIRIVSPLASGGMGDVYEGYDQRLGRKVALKAIRADHRLKPAAKARFLREARILSQLDHPHICRIYDYIEGDDTDFLVLELIEGKNLAQSLTDGIDRQRAFTIGIELAEVLAAAHAKGVVHRDLKPQNVMITPHGEAKVLDFGLARPLAASRAAIDDLEARPLSGSPGMPSSSGAAEEPALDSTELMPIPRVGSGDEEEAGSSLVSGPASDTLDGLHTALGSVVGTPRYMSPEQARGEPVTAASDLFSLGLLLQELFTGRSAYPRGLARRQLVELARRGQSPPPEGLDTDLTKLIQRLKSPAPSARPPAVDVARELAWIRGKPKRRMQRLAIVAVAIILLAVAVKYTLDLRAARDEALHRREQAEDLIGFMLGDLSQKLKPVGRLDVLADVDDKALQYFASLPANDLSDSELFKHAQALSEIGQVRLSQGHYAKAMQAHRDALGLLERLVPRHPKNADWRSALGTAHFWIGYDLWNEGDLKAALDEMKVYLATSERLERDFSQDSKWRMETAEGHVNVALILKAQGHTSEAIKEFQGAAQLMERLVAERPKSQEWLDYLRATRSWLGDALLEGGDLNGALEQHLQEQQLARRLVELAPDTAQWKHRLEVSDNKVGLLLDAAGRLDEATKQLEEGRKLAQSLTARDPSNAQWRYELAATETALAHTFLDLHQVGKAEPLLSNARAHLRQLFPELPKELPDRQLLASAKLLEARLLLIHNLPRKALAAAERADLVLSPPVAEKEKTAGPLLRSRLEYGLVSGLALQALKRKAEARKQWRTGLAELHSMPTQISDPRVRANEALLLLQLGRVNEATKIIKALHQIGYHDPELEAACRQFHIAV